MELSYLPSHYHCLLFSFWCLKAWLPFLHFRCSFSDGRSHPPCPHPQVRMVESCVGLILVAVQKSCCLVCWALPACSMASGAVVFSSLERGWLQQTRWRHRAAQNQILLILLRILWWFHELCKCGKSRSLWRQGRPWQEPLCFVWLQFIISPWLEQSWWWTPLLWSPGIHPVLVPQGLVHVWEEALKVTRKIAAWEMQTPASDPVSLRQTLQPSWNQPAPEGPAEAGTVGHPHFYTSWQWPVMALMGSSSLWGWYWGRSDLSPLFILWDSWILQHGWEPQDGESWLTAKDACDARVMNWRNKRNTYRGVNIPQATYMREIC